MNEPCAVCGYDADEWDDADTTNTMLVAGPMLDYALEGAPPGATATPATDVHDLVHQMAAIAAARHDAGDVVGPLTGTVSRINTSNGGLPKAAVPSAEIGRRGVVGDRQRNRRHHGRPFQALCLWSSDVIEALRAEGHPIEPGSAGENLTVAGTDWSQMRSGLLVQIGTALARTSTPAPPCTHNNRWFADHDSQRISHERHPGWSRWYAWVLRPGHAATGDPVRVWSAGSDAPTPEG